MEKVLFKSDLWKILAQNNKEVFALLEKRDAGDVGTEEYNELMHEITFENGEAIMLVKLIEYLEGKRKLEDIA